MQKFLFQESSKIGLGLDPDHTNLKINLTLTFSFHVTWKSIKNIYSKVVSTVPSLTTFKLSRQKKLIEHSLVYDRQTKQYVPFS